MHIHKTIIPPPKMSVEELKNSIVEIINRSSPNLTVCANFNSDESDEECKRKCARFIGCKWINTYIEFYFEYPLSSQVCLTKRQLEQKFYELFKCCRMYIYTEISKKKHAFLDFTSCFIVNSVVQYTSCTESDWIECAKLYIKNRMSGDRMPKKFAYDLHELVGPAPSAMDPTIPPSSGFKRIKRPSTPVEAVI